MDQKNPLTATPPPCSASATGIGAPATHATFGALGFCATSAPRGARRAWADERNALCVSLLAARAGRMKTAARATAARSTTANLLCIDYPLLLGPAPCRNGACITPYVRRSRLFALSVNRPVAEVWMSLAGPMVQQTP